VRKTLGLQLVFLLAGAAMAQDHRHFPAALGSGLPPLQPTAPRTAPPRGPGRGFPMRPGYLGGYGWGGYGWGGYGLSGYPLASPDVAPPVNNTVVFEPPVIPAPPPEPIHSSIQDLKPAASNAPPAFFVIALKNGSQLTAAAVWVQGNDLRYVDADDQNHRVPLADIDRAATRTLNQAHNLNLRLPPPTQ